MILKLTPVLILLMTSFVAGYGAVVQAAESKTASFHETARFQIGGDGGWDYLMTDADTRRVYIARSSRVLIIDTDSGKSIGEVTGLDGAHGVVLMKDRGIGFASSGKSGEVVAFDLTTFKTIQRIKAGDNPDAILYDHASKKIFAFNGKSRDISVIDPQTMKNQATIPVGGKPEFAVSDGTGRVYVNIEDTAELLAIDSIHLKILGRYPLKPCEAPTGLSMDVARRRLIVGCGNRLAVVVDADTGHVSQTFNVGSGVDATAFDPTRNLAFVSAGEGFLSILSEDSSGFHLLQELPTIKGARTLAVDSKTGHVFLPIAQFKPASHTDGPAGHERPTVIPGTFGVLVVGR